MSATEDGKNKNPIVVSQVKGFKEEAFLAARKANELNEDVTDEVDNYESKLL